MPKDIKFLWKNDDQPLWVVEGRTAVTTRIEELYREKHITVGQMEILRWVRNNHMDNDATLSAKTKDEGLQYQLLINGNSRFSFNWDYPASLLR